MKKNRIDVLLVEQGLAESRQRAKALIMAGAVLVNDHPIDKAGATVPADAKLRLRGNPIPFVSRGGLKLQHALAAFVINPTGLSALDVGVSTGGFTDCLLQRGARRVTGVDVGKGQVAWKLRTDERVTLLEGTNARYMDPASLGEPFDMAVIDVSFISLTLILPVVFAALRPGGLALPMVKPQFEVGRADVGRKGVVRDPEKRLAAVDKIRDCSETLGFQCLGHTESPVPGPQGNIEYFLHLLKPTA